MIQQQSLEAANSSRRRVEVPHFRGSVTHLIDSPTDAPLPRPQAFLVEQDPNWVLPTHFHQEHQFQLFTAGSGSLGKHALPPLAVHYASPHSAYGPLISSHEGIAYLTLRAVTDQGAWILPQKRESLLTRVPKLQLHAAPSTFMDDARLYKLMQTEKEQLMDPLNGGPGAWIVRLPPDACTKTPEIMPGSAGRFHVLTRGQMCVKNQWSNCLSTVWSNDSESLEIRAGAQGAELVILEFPAAASRSFVEDMDLVRAPY